MAETLLERARRYFEGSGRERQKGRVRFDLAKAALLVLSLFIFILALQLLKEGAKTVAPLVRETFRVENPLNALGFGWLFAYIVMSGSPVAAASLTFLAHQAISPIETFAMIAGSRLGASLIVLLLGFLYVLRGQEKRGGLASGLLSLAVTATLYLPALPLGYLLLRSGRLAGIQLRVGALDVIDRLTSPLVMPVVERLPGLAVFVLGLATIMAAFSLVDRGLPQVQLRRGVPGLVYRPIVMFLLGVAVTTVSLSVSVSLGVLVPLTARGLIRRENVIPYIMGCNVSTFVDTLAVAVLLGSPEGFTVVLVEMLSVALVSLAVLAAGFHLYERGIVVIVDWALVDNRNLAVFMAAFLLVPAVLVLL